MTTDLALNKLRENEKRIQTGLNAFLDVGMALLEVRDNELYKADGWATFEDYCQGRWPQIPETTRIYKVNTAAVKVVLGEDVKNAHAYALREVLKDDSKLMQETWAEVSQIEPEKITAEYVKTVAKKHWLMEHSGPLGEAVELQKITPEKAWVLQRVLMRLPEEYSIAVLNFGIGQDCVQGETLNAIQALSYQDKDAAQSILQSGYLDDIPLWQLTPQDVQRLQRRLSYEKAQAQILRAIDKQKEQISGSNSRIFDSVGTWQIEDDPLLYFIFANGTITPDEIFTFIKNHNLGIFFLAAYDPLNPPNINFDGIGVKPDAIKVKPSNVITYIQNATL